MGLGAGEVAEEEAVSGDADREDDDGLNDDEIGLRRGGLCN